MPLPRVQELETPALLVDLDVMERNLRTMSRFLAGRQARFRPHFKNHRSLDLARRQVEHGASGFTCARVGEAELLVGGGHTDILLANEVACRSKLERLVELERRGAPVVLAIDDPEVAQCLGALGRAAGVEPQVVIDVDLGLNRCGVRSVEDAVSLAIAAREAGLRVRGVAGYEGHLQMLAPGAQKEDRVREACQLLLRARSALEAAGFRSEIVSMGGTGTYAMVASYPGVTEVQPGTFMFMDTGYAEVAPEFLPALTLLASVISRSNGRAVLDAGVKAISSERGMPGLKNLSSGRLRALHAEHALVDVHDDGGSLRVGDRVEMWVHYSDGTVNLHDRIYGVRSGGVESEFHVERAGSAL